MLDGHIKAQSVVVRKVYMATVLDTLLWAQSLLSQTSPQMVAVFFLPQCPVPKSVNPILGRLR